MDRSGSVLTRMIVEASVGSDGVETAGQRDPDALYLLWFPGGRGTFHRVQRFYGLVGNPIKVLVGIVKKVCLSFQRLIGGVKRE